MSDENCNNSACADGNCEGCKDGEIFCSDPRCSPRCRNCHPTRHSSMTAIIYFAVFMFAVIFAYFIYATYFRDKRGY